MHWNTAPKSSTSCEPRHRLQLPLMLPIRFGNSGVRHHLFQLLRKAMGNTANRLQSVGAKRGPQSVFFQASDAPPTAEHFRQGPQAK